MATAGTASGLVIQALRWMGQRHTDEKRIVDMRRRLSRADKEQLLRDVRYAPGWIAEIMRKVAQSADK